jgi:translation initiation factor IF-1
VAAAVVVAAAAVDARSRIIAGKFRKL